MMKTVRPTRPVRPARPVLSKFLAVALCAAAFAPAQAAEYEIDLSHSFIQFRTQHLGVSWLLGRFNEFSGEFTYDPAAGPGAQEIRVEVETASVDSNHAERDKHLRDDDFLDVDEFPTATFVGTNFSGDENGGTMQGEFTLHGVTRPVEVAVKKVGEGDDPWGGYRAGFEGRFSIMRSEFGIDRNLGPLSERVDLEIYIEGVRR